MRVLLLAFLIAAGCVGQARADEQEQVDQGQRPLVLPFASAKPVREVTPADLQTVYDEVRTPFKYGVVLAPEDKDRELLDCPNVFRHEGKWYMVYVRSVEKVGYETCLAESDDLLAWRPVGTILPFQADGWDRWQAAAGIALVNPSWETGPQLQSYDDRYWATYLGGAKQGYETDPLAIGVAWTKTPALAEPWQRHQGNPVLEPSQADARPFERATLYKSYVLWDQERTLGHPFVMFYNGKQQGPWIERIGMAVSDDMLNWQRYGDGPVIDNGKGISGDPQVVKMGDLWVMFYFGAGWQPRAFDTFACSTDLVHWTKWTGPNVIEPSEPYDKTFAHKPWLLKHEGVVYHFYCAVGEHGRTIALATSRDFRAAESAPNR